MPGQPRPPNAPRAVPLGLGVQPGAPNTIVARVVIITGAGDGLFVYNGTPGLGNPPIFAITTASTDPYGNVVTPDAATVDNLPFLFYSPSAAAGNLIASVARAAGTDSFGNAYDAGFTTYANDGFGSFIQQNTGLLVFGNSAHPTQVTGAGAIEFNTAGDLVISDGSTGGVISLNSDGNVMTSRLVAAVGGAEETWHTFTPQNGFTTTTDPAGATVTPAYKLLPDGNVAIEGTVNTPATGSVTAITITTLPAGYLPTVNVAYVQVNQKSGVNAGFLGLHPNGNVQLLSGNFGNSQAVVLNGIFALH